MRREAGKAPLVTVKINGSDERSRRLIKKSAGDERESEMHSTETPRGNRRQSVIILSNGTVLLLQIGYNYRAGYSYPRAEGKKKERWRSARGEKKKERRQGR